MKLSDEAAFDRIYTYHQLLCGKLGLNPIMPWPDRLAILGMRENEEKLCYNSAIEHLQELLSDNFSL